MGRELSVNRLDVTVGGYVIRPHAGYVCGRDDFTNHLASIFCNQDTEFLIITESNEKPDLPEKIHVTCEDEGFSDKEFDIEYKTMDYNTFMEICDEYVKDDEYNLRLAKESLSDARIARQRSLNVEAFTEFSTLVEDLEDFIRNYNDRAYRFRNYVMNLRHEIINGRPDRWGTWGPEPMEPNEHKLKSYILLTYSE